jgi:hypothetical protein
MADQNDREHTAIMLDDFHRALEAIELPGPSDVLAFFLALDIDCRQVDWAHFLVAGTVSATCDRHVRK